MLKKLKLNGSMKTYKTFSSPPGRKERASLSQSSPEGTKASEDKGGA